MTRPRRPHFTGRTAARYTGGRRSSTGRRLMEYGIQRRSVYLAPPSNEDLGWVFRQFDTPEIYDMFGFLRPSSAKILRAYRTGNLVLGIIHRVETEARIGFIVLFPPAGDLDFWEFGFAIQDSKDRDAFSALNAADAMLSYAFDHLRLARVGWRVREDNRASLAVVRRFGYGAPEKRVVDGHSYVFSFIDTETWTLRKTKLDRGEAEHPSGLGATFITLAPPYTPARPALSRER